ncbi:unnamed protein product [Durusdinium trenchii]|uniref:Hflx-type G domain-containing protein n=1 Tax=Durusdinium trenchii TaxID=1381693 RepID=A0ABP0SBB7_9DINO
MLGFCAKDLQPAAFKIFVRAAPLRSWSCHTARAFRAFRGFRGRNVSSWSRVDGKAPRVLVVHPRLPGENEQLVPWDAAEAVALARAVGWQSVQPGENPGLLSSSSEDEETESEDEVEEEVEAYVARLERVDPKFYFHVQELSRVAVLVARSKADVLFVNASLSPAQQRHLEVAMDLAWRAARQSRSSEVQLHQSSISVFDRSRTVLAIFARRASTQNARLSIELAEAQEVKARLGAGAVQGITLQLQRVANDLSRKVAGCSKTALLSRSGSARGVTTSFTSSPQITRQKQQRAIEEKEKRLREEIASLQKARRTRRQQRSRDGLQSIGLVGYTNVGKSAIVNRLAGSDLVVKDGVFVTLDLAARRFELPSGSQCHILDSVGFIKDLPIELVEVFQATIQELQAATVILHVRDMAHPSREEQGQTVRSVLDENGIEEERVIEVWNKTDLLTERQVQHLLFLHRRKDDASPVPTISALTGDGFDHLLETVEKKLQDLSVKLVPGLNTSTALEVSCTGPQLVRIPHDLPPQQAADLWSFLHETSSVVEDSIASCKDTSDVLLEVKMDNATRSRKAHIL